MSSGLARELTEPDAFLGLAKTCAKLSLSFWDDLGARLGVPGQRVIPYLPDLVRARRQPA